MNKALKELIEQPLLSVAVAAHRYNVAETTLWRHLTVPQTKHRRGPPPIFTEREEEALLVHLEIYANLGLDVRSDDLLNKANELLAKKRSKPGNAALLPEKLGRKWVHRFFCRHPQLTKKKGSRTDPQRWMLSRESLTAWFESFRKLMETKGIPTGRIFNADETPLPLYPDQRGKLIAFKKQSRRRRQKEDRSSMTMVATIASDGALGRPLFIVKRKTVDIADAIAMPKRSGITHAEKGFITCHVFGLWIDMVIEEFNIRLDNPGLLLMDAHRSRENVPALRKAVASGLHVIILPGKSTADLQPLDKVVFAPFKSKYRAMIATEEKKVAMKDNWTQGEIIKVACEAFTVATTEHLAKQAFAKTGIQPYNPEPVISKMCEGKKVIDLVNDDLREVLAANITTVPKPPKKPSKRLKIAGRILTDEAVLAEMEAHKSQTALTKRRRVELVGQTRAPRKPPVCAKCGLPRKGHPKGFCQPRADDSESEVNSTATDESHTSEESVSNTSPSDME